MARRRFPTTPTPFAPDTGLVRIPQWSAAHLRWFELAKDMPSNWGDDEGAHDLIWVPPAGVANDYYEADTNSAFALYPPGTWDEGGSPTVVPSTTQFWGRGRSVDRRGSRGVAALHPSSQQWQVVWMEAPIQLFRARIDTWDSGTGEGTIDPAGLEILQGDLWLTADGEPPTGWDAGGIGTSPGSANGTDYGEGLFAFYDGEYILLQIVGYYGAEPGAYSAPSGGLIVDTECRASLAQAAMQIANLITVLRRNGFLPLT
jgi:hypothetical protein